MSEWVIGGLGGAGGGEKRQLAREGWVCCPTSMLFFLAGDAEDDEATKTLREATTTRLRKEGEA